jgi:hypothetical protein
MRWTDEASRCEELGTTATKRDTIRLLHHENSLKIELAAP